MGILARLKGFDAYNRPEAHLTRKTVSGAIVSIVGVTLMVLLFGFELVEYVKPQRVTTMGVDVTRDELLTIHVDMTYPGLPCQVLSLDALDVSGKHEVDIGGELHKERVSAAGKSLGVYESHREDEDGFLQFFRGFGGVQIESPNRKKHVEEIKAALHEHEGCRVHGHMKVQRVAGNFHVSVHSQSYQTLQMVFNDASRINVSHVIHQLSFGDSYPGKVDPLAGFVRIIKDSEESGTYKYFLKIVPTTYTKKRGVLDGYLASSGEGGVGDSKGEGGKKGRDAGAGKAWTRNGTLRTNLYSVTEYYSASKGWESTLPAVYFLYDLSPITMEISEGPRSLGHFFTRVCAVVGGMFAVTGMTDRWIHRAVNLMNKVD